MSGTRVDSGAEMEAVQGNAGRVDWSRFVPGVFVWLATALVLMKFGTSALDVLRYSAYLAFCVTLPGMLVWRALRGNVDGFVADLTFGTGLGLVGSIFAYLPARALGVPLAGLAVPVAALIAFVALPSLATNWQSGGAVLPRWWSWGVGAACLLGLAVITRFGLVMEPMTFPDAAYQYVDMPFHLALAGDLRHHFPAQIPYVAGEPLYYHWFVHAQAAASSWHTGIELDQLLRRFLPVTVTLLTVLAVAVLATRLTRLAWAGPVAGGLVLLVTTFDVYGWNGTGPVMETGFASGVLMYSPTQAFGMFLALPVIWLVIALLRGDGARAGSWILLVVGLVGVSGAKATFVPMVTAGLLAVVVVRLILTRRFDRLAACLAASTVVVLAFAQAVLFGGTTAGTSVQILRTFTDLAPRYGLAGDGIDVFVVLMSATVSWAMVAAGMAGFARNRKWRERDVIFLVGFVGSGLMAAAIASQHGLSQVYFLRGLFPVAIAGSVWGLSVLLAGRSFRVLAPWLVVAFLAGLLISWRVTTATPDKPGLDDGAAAWQVTWPWLLVVGGALALVLLSRLTPPRWRLRGLGAAVAVMLLLGASSLNVPGKLADLATDTLCTAGPERPDCYNPLQRIPRDGPAAARFIRDRSAPSDVLATNSHCTPTSPPKLCDARNFWLAAYAERRVLLAGWAYTPTANARADSAYQAIFGAYWDPGLRRANDAVFQTNPSKADLMLLRERYGVRWLVFDTTLGRASPAVRKMLPRRFKQGSLEVYELVAVRGGPVATPAPRHRERRSAGGES